MTLYQTIQEVACVFFPLEDAWHDAAAREFPDRDGRAGRDPLENAAGGVRAPVAGGIGPASGLVRIFPDRKMVDPAA